MLVRVSPTEEGLEHVEGVGVVLLTALVRLQPLFTMAVIDLAFRGVGQYLIG